MKCPVCKVPAEDVAKIKDIKAWLDAHDQSTELYAYLSSSRDL